MGGQADLQALEGIARNDPCTKVTHRSKNYPTSQRPKNLRMAPKLVWNMSFFWEREKTNQN